MEEQNNLAENKKHIIERIIATGDKRSYNEIAADLELMNWTAQNKGWDWVNTKKKFV